MRSESLALEMHGVSRHFRSPAGLVAAVCDVDLELHRGEVVGVLGPNGAGKTTTIKMAATLLEPTSGTVHVNGIDAVRRPRDARQHLGLVLGGDRGFYMRATGAENLAFFAELQGVTRKRARRVGHVLDLVGLADASRARVETYSRGMRQRLHIGRALLSNPSLVLLDEPSIGLDPEGAHDLRQIVKDLRHDDRAVLLTTHYLVEAEELADRLMVIADGAVVAAGQTHDIARRAGVSVVTSVTSRGQGDPAEAIAQLRAVADVTSLYRNGIWNVTVVWKDASIDRAALDAALSAHEVLSDLQRPASLEEAYLAFIHRHRVGGKP